VGIPARKLECEGRQWGRTSGSQSTSLYYLYYVTRSLSKIASISNFLRVRLATLYMVRENAGRKLMLITEPEAAALACATLCDEVDLREGDRFLVCDAGGGTVVCIRSE
jgi:hypothetical protein